MSHSFSPSLSVLPPGNDVTTTVLLTGGTGVLGRALIEELAPEHRLICLRHRTPLEDLRVTELPADLLAPRLGLSPAGWRELAGKVDLVLHSAAATNWQSDPAEIRRTNVQGTLALQELAEQAAAPFAYVSTAFVASPVSDAERERFPGATTYLDSKREAEEAVRRAAERSGLPSLILRPSVVMGDSTTGRIAGVQGLTRALGAIVTGQVPVLPGTPTSRIDVLPQDVVARAIGDLIRGGAYGTDGACAEHWITAGSAALRQCDIVDACLEFAGELGLDAQRPRLLPVEAVHRLLLPLAEDSGLPKVVCKRLRDYAELLLVFQQEMSMPSSLGTPACPTTISTLDLQAALRRNLESWAAGRPGLLTRIPRLPAAGPKPSGTETDATEGEIAS